MQQFIPFEDDWDALEKLHPDALIPYRVGLIVERMPRSAMILSVPATYAGESPALEGKRDAA